jgi:hypothetical protein
MLRGSSLVIGLLARRNVHGKDGRLYRAEWLIYKFAGYVSTQSQQATSSSYHQVFSRSSINRSAIHKTLIALDIGAPLVFPTGGRGLSVEQSSNDLWYHPSDELNLLLLH